MIKTDIILKDDLTGQESFFMAKDNKELLKCMQAEGIKKCNVTYTFLGLDAYTAHVTIEDVRKAIEEMQKEKV